ncbi:MAG: hypothetical protein KME47_10115 [Nodosilinea sp. WJT8-NPBG4]|jgi:hypothetical protein|nr:hypothetical protein [Nodosilinea sp. WJT8-NPBG4]
MVNAKVKGTRGETELKSAFYDQIGFYLVRNPDQTRKGGYDCSIRYDDDLDSPIAIPFAIEFKRNESLSTLAMWKQALGQVTKSCFIPVVAYRRNRCPWEFIVPWAIIKGVDGPYCPEFEGTAILHSPQFFEVAREWVDVKANLITKGK